MKKEIIEIFVIIMLLSTTILVPIVVAEDLTDEEVLELVETEMGEDMIQITKLEYEEGWDYLFSNLTGEAFMEAVVDGEEYELTKVYAVYVDNGTLNESVLADYNVSKESNGSHVDTIVAGGEWLSQNVTISAGVIVVEPRTVYVAGINVFGVTLFRLYCRAIWFVEVLVRIVHIIDLSTTWHNIFFFLRTDFDHDATNYGSYGYVDADATFQIIWLPTEQWMLWAWQRMDKNLDYTFDYDMEKL